MIINPFMVAAASTTTSKVKVRIAEFDDQDDCACSLTSTYEIWENDAMVHPSAGNLTLSVDDWISGGSASKSGSPACAQVVSLNETGTAVGQTSTEYSDCADCNDNELLCSESPGGPGGGPGGGGPPPKCLLPDMLVKRLNGSLARVTDLSLGDLIWTPSGTTQVIKLMKDHPSSPREGYYIIEDELCLTNDHPILVDGKMVRAEDYPGVKQYVEELTSTVYVGTVAPTFNVYCGDNVYVVDGQVK